MAKKEVERFGPGKQFLFAGLFVLILNVLEPPTSVDDIVGSLFHLAFLTLFLNVAAREGYSEGFADGTKWGRSTPNYDKSYDKT